MTRIILVGKGAPAQNIHVVLTRAVPGSSILPVTTLEELARTPLTGDTWLISHSTSVIVPADVLEALPGRAVNIHAASPAYPGRDPHHFAIYDSAARYGATAHIMTTKIDDGAILDVEWFNVASNETPATLLAKANTAALKVAERLVPKLLAGTATPNGERWGTPKTTRRAFQALCEITPDMPAIEIDRRRRAVAIPGRANLFVVISGIRFTHTEPEN